MQDAIDGTYIGPTFILYSVKYSENRRSDGGENVKVLAMNIQAEGPRDLSSVIFFALNMFKVKSLLKQ